MFEKIAQKCFNYIGGECAGGFFKFVSGKVTHWVDPEFADRPCRITHKKYCNWFATRVVPGIPQKDSYLRASGEKWKEKFREQTETHKYIRMCKKCGKRFRSDTYNKMYCDTCRRVNV